MPEATSFQSMFSMVTHFFEKAQVSTLSLRQPWQTGGNVMSSRVVSSLFVTRELFGTGFLQMRSHMLHRAWSDPQLRCRPLRA